VLLDIAGQIVFEIVSALGWESVKHEVRRERESTPVLAAMGHFLMGVAAGILSLLIVGWRLTSQSPLPGLSLVLSPVGTGLAMQWIGKFLHDHGMVRPSLFSFRAGAIFAFGMALVRFVYLELHWTAF
jgi:hypothetical protein